MPKDLNAEMNKRRAKEEAAMRASLKPQQPPKRPPKKKDLNAEMNKNRAKEEAAMRAMLSKEPDSLIAPNSSVRGQGGKGCNCGKGITIDNKSSAKDGLKRIAPAPGWGSNANGNYDPSPPAIPNF